MQVVAYTRVSTSEQGNRAVEDRLGLQAQIAAIKRFCEFEGHEIIGHYEEVISAKYGFEERLKLRAAFHKAKSEGAYVLVSKLDRLSRTVEFIGHLMNNDYKFGTVEDGFKYDPSMIYMRAVFAEDERRKIATRTKEALAVRKAQGMELGGIRTTGRYAERLELSKAVVSAEANSFALRIKPVIARMRDSKMTVHQIAAELNEQGNKTARGGQWHGSTVNNILKRLEIA